MTRLAWLTRLPKVAALLWVAEWIATEPWLLPFLAGCLLIPAILVLGVLLLLATEER